MALTFAALADVTMISGFSPAANRDRHGIDHH
jgi:hypothetical protein